MTITPNEYPATAECPQCEHEVETTLYVYRDGSGAYIYGRHCPECDEAVAMDVSFTLSGAVRWNAGSVPGSPASASPWRARCGICHPTPPSSVRTCAAGWARSP